jgi:hypothetical protein
MAERQKFAGAPREATGVCWCLRSVENLASVSHAKEVFQEVYSPKFLVVKLLNITSQGGS